jgi:hypothetical protein
MKAPQAIDAFLEILRDDQRIIQLLVEHPDSDLAQLADSGDLEDLMKSEAVTESTIEASGGEENFFDINIESFCKVYWIQANEFDDIGYFASEKEASDHASEEYAPYIETAAEWACDDDEEE